MFIPTTSPARVAVRRPIEALQRARPESGRPRPTTTSQAREAQKMRLICRQKRYRLSPQRRVQVCRMRQAVREGDKAWLKSENH